MPSVSMRQMLEAGVHFGHQTRFWNPKMEPYIFGERNKIHIINLEKTQPLFAEAAAFIKQVVADGGTVLFVGTKRSARDAIQKEAVRCAMPYRQSALARRHADQFQDHPRLDQAAGRTAGDGQLPARSTSAARRRRRSCGARWSSSSAVSGASRAWRRCRTALFVIDVGHEHIAIHEARKLGIPVVAVVDTNCSPDGIDHVIPGNDDAMRAIQLYAAAIAEAVLEGKSSVPQVAVGEDEFVELDEEGNPRRKSARPGRPQAGRRGAPQDPAAAPSGGDAAAPRRQRCADGCRRWRPRCWTMPSRDCRAGRGAGPDRASKRRTGAGCGHGPCRAAAIGAGAERSTQLANH